MKTGETNTFWEFFFYSCMSTCMTSVKKISVKNFAHLKAFGCHLGFFFSRKRPSKVSLLQSVAWNHDNDEHEVWNEYCYSPAHVI